MGHDLTLSEIHKHHDHLVRDIHQHFDSLVNAARGGDSIDIVRDRFVIYLDTELIPHALTEEETVYQDGASEADLRLLVDGMTDEHQRIIRLIGQMRAADSPAEIVAAAGGFIAMLDAHFDKENRLLLPALNSRGLLPD
jgi:hypothetical protein